MAKQRYFAVTGVNPNGTTFHYGVAWTRAGGLALQRFARRHDPRFMAEFKVEEVERKDLARFLELTD